MTTTIKSKPDTTAAVEAKDDDYTTSELFRERLERARQVAPIPKDRHCLDCFNRGRNAAIKVLLGE